MKEIIIHIIGSIFMALGLALGGLGVTDYQWWIVFVGFLIVYLNA